MKQKFSGQERIATTAQQSNIHIELAQTVWEHRRTLRRYFEKVNPQPDVHHHLQQAIALVKRTALNYRHEDVEIILERLNPISITHETAFIHHHSGHHSSALHPAGIGAEQS